MNTTSASLSEDIPGVFQARQKRSIRIRDGFINAGVDALNSNRFSDLKISDLANNSGNSVGSFYTRFQDKDAFFRALGAYSTKSLDQNEIANFNKALTSDLHSKEALDLLVDLLEAIFTSRFRGVLRESLLRILEPDDPWAPMRDSAQNVVLSLHENLPPLFPHFTPEEAKNRLSFCFQMIVGVLQNDLVNDYHIFKTRDQTLSIGLKEAVCAYMQCPR